MEKPNGLKVVTLTMSDMVRQMENAIQFGDPVLIQDVLEAGAYTCPLFGST